MELFSRKPAVREPAVREPAVLEPAGRRAGGEAAPPSRARRIAARITTVAAGLLVLVALLAPNQLGRLTPGAFVRVPVEGLLGVALLLSLSARSRRAVATVLGVILGLVTLVKILDMGFYEARARPFHVLLDWTMFGPAVEFVGNEIGHTAAGALAGALVLLAIALVVAVTRSVRRLGRLAVRHRTVTARTATVLGLVWVFGGLLGLEVVPGVPVAAASAADIAFDQVRRVRADLRDREAFASQSAVDPFGDTPAADLLTALRGKDVVVAFIESYGRVALDDPRIAARIAPILDAGTQRLRAAGFESRSAFLTSPTAGGGSWLAHSTLQSGLWIDNQQRYVDLVAGDRLTLSGAFLRAGWRTVGVAPANNRNWPEGAFYQFEQLYDLRNLGYEGPRFSFASIPDQFTLAAFQRAERAADHPPVMAQIDLVSSHAPWSPVPPILEWDAIGDGSVYDAESGARDPPTSVLKEEIGKVRADYRTSMSYSLNVLISYVETHGDDDLVLVFLGDHQPAPIIAGDGPNRDAPITIVARDPAVLDRIADWGWQDGLRPGPTAPVWRMDTFRDRFLTAFGAPRG